MIQFNHRGASHSLTGGQAFADPSKAGFRDASVQELQALIAEIAAGRPWRTVVQERFAATKPWLYQIITAPARTAFFETVLPSGPGPVLDVGAGWGQTCRPLAKRCPVVALEPVAERLGFVQAAAKQDGVANNLTFIGADYFNIGFETKFAAICAIGVLEWVGAFQNHLDPQERQTAFLRKTRSELAPGGSLVLGIENRLGLKYLFGCPDDHLGVPHVACLPAPLARRRWQDSSGQPLKSFTYSQSELEDLLRQAGFTNIEFFGAFPDYKLPETIVPLAQGGQELNAWLRTGTIPAEHNGYNGDALTPEFQERLVAKYRELAATNRAQRFVPSFFVRAS